MEKTFKAKIINNEIVFMEKKDLSKFEDKSVDVVIVFDKNRTLPQNAYYWSVIIPIIAQEIGESTETTHEILKHKFLKRSKDLTNKKGEKEVVEKVVSTRTLSTTQFVQYSDAVKRWASQWLGLYIPDPGEVYITDDLIIN